MEKYKKEMNRHERSSRKVQHMCRWNFRKRGEKNAKAIFEETRAKHFLELTLEEERW
jgi:hypothetical protein